MRQIPLGVPDAHLSDQAESRSRQTGVMLETRHLSRRIAQRALVQDVSVQVSAGEILAVVGPSGAGKSSFLRLLNRLDEATSGTVLLKSRDYRSIAPQELRRRIGMVMQTDYLFPGTVSTNIAFGPSQHGETLAAAQIASLLERVGLAGFEDRDVGNLSGGEAQRVALARTPANVPEVLLLDEPTSALDEVSARGIEERFLGIVQERRMACVIVTHNRAQAARLARVRMAQSLGVRPATRQRRDRAWAGVQKFCRPHALGSTSTCRYQGIRPLTQHYRERERG